MGRLLDEIIKRCNIRSEEELIEWVDRALAELDASPEYPEGKCHFCHTQTTNWDFCPGCGYHICQECTGPPDLVPIGRHVIETHRMIWN